MVPTRAVLLFEQEETAGTVLSAGHAREVQMHEGQERECLAELRERMPAITLEGFAPEAMRRLAEYEWPGNVRELEHFVENVAITETAPMVTVDVVEARLPGQSGDHPLDRARRQLLSLRELEQVYIAWVLEKSGGNKTRAAEILGIDPSTLYRRETRGKG